MARACLDLNASKMTKGGGVGEEVAWMGIVVAANKGSREGTDGSLYPWAYASGMAAIVGAVCHMAWDMDKDNSGMLGGVTGSAEVDKAHSDLIARCDRVWPVEPVTTWADVGSW